MKKGVISRMRERISPEAQRFVRRNLDIAQRVAYLLDQHGWTQRDLARAVGKSESEISKWLSGQHNLTLKSIALLENALDADILVAPDNQSIGAKQAPHEELLSQSQAP